MAFDRKEYQRLYALAHRDRANERFRHYRINHIEQERERHRIYSVKRRAARALARNAISRPEKIPEEIIKARREKTRRWDTKRLATVEGRLWSNVRRRIRNALKDLKPVARTTELVGCSRTELRLHIESLFRGGMTWDSIHIDHIMPCCAFDLSDPPQQFQCFKYTNLQPLFPKENRQKRAADNRLRREKERRIA